MSELTYGNHGAATRDRTHTLFGQTMGYVAITAGCVSSREVRTERRGFAPPGTDGEG